MYVYYPCVLYKYDARNVSQESMGLCELCARCEQKGYYSHLCVYVCGNGDTSRTMDQKEIYNETRKRNATYTIDGTQLQL